MPLLPSTKPRARSPCIHQQHRKAASSSNSQQLGLCRQPTTAYSAAAAARAASEQQESPVPHSLQLHISIRAARSDAAT